MKSVQRKVTTQGSARAELILPGRLAAMRADRTRPQYAGTVTIKPRNGKPRVFRVSQQLLEQIVQLVDAEWLHS